MAFIGTKKFGELQDKMKIIDPFKDTRLKSGAYELSLGSEIFRTDSKDKKTEILKDGEQISINPGQFALLLTEELVNIPLDKIAFISIKAKIKLRGLVNVSGFHVDPGFNGKLVFSVYNAGVSQISLKKGEPCFLIWLAELSEQETESYRGEHKDQDSIPLRYVDDLTKEDSELASPNVLLKKINENQTILETKISVVEERKKLNEYLIKTIIGILIFLTIRYLWEAGQYYKGYKDGYDKKSTELTCDSSNKLIQYELNALKMQIEQIQELNKEVQPKSEPIKSIK
ncbi:MAG: dCTP deaminase domain-containing protein [Flavobacteriales bacterium]